MPRDTWERWDVQANHHLLAYLLEHSPRLVRSYPGQQTELHKLFNAFKQSWAADMRILDPVPADAGLAMWTDNMQRAEAEITRQLGPPKTGVRGDPL